MYDCFRFSFIHDNQSLGLIASPVIGRLLPHIVVLNTRNTKTDMFVSTPRSFAININSQHIGSFILQ